MDKPTIILATSNGIGMGHLARASAIALELKDRANPVLVSVAGGIAEIPSTMGIPCEYIPGKHVVGCRHIAGIDIFVID